MFLKFEIISWNVFEIFEIWKKKSNLPVSWLSGSAFVFGAGDLKLKSQASQIEHIAANGSPPLQHFFEWSCVAWAYWSRDGPRQLVTRFGVIQRV